MGVTGTAQWEGVIAMKRNEKSVTHTVGRFPLIVTTAVPDNSLLLVSSPASEDTSAISHAIHDLEQNFYRQRNSSGGEEESPEKRSVVEVRKNIRLGSRRYLISITVDVSGAEARTISRQTTSLDGALIQNLDTRSAMGGHSA